MNPDRGSRSVVRAFALSSVPLVLAALLSVTTAGEVAAVDHIDARPAISLDGKAFSTWQEYYSSQYFVEEGKRCGKPPTIVPKSASPSDCGFNSTNPASQYIPGSVYRIPVVVHIIKHSNGDGEISNALVQSQIDVLNEDFRALLGTPGSGGYDVAIEFYLATTDPGGSATDGITRTTNDNWFNDNGSYWNSLAWDTSRYMNVYTNLAGGNLGYVPSLPQSGIAGNDSDRIVILWTAFGRNSIGGGAYNQGRTLTHEVGHYLGLEHTFEPEGSCPSAASPSCYSSGDLICDTNPEHQPTYDCPAGGASCGSSDPIDNYMDYTDDACMAQFTMEQALRMRCSLIHYREDLYSTGVCGNGVIESGEQCDTSNPGSCPTGACDPDCTCEDPVCGNGIREPGEICDGGDDNSCPGECDGVTCQCPCSDHAFEKVSDRFTDTVVRFKGLLAGSTTTFDQADPRNGFGFEITQGGDKISLAIPSGHLGWAKSKPAKGKYAWKGDVGGFTRVKALDRTHTSLGGWKIMVKGKLVPDSATIDELSAYEIYLLMGDVCNRVTY